MSVCPSVCLSVSMCMPVCLFVRLKQPQNKSAPLSLSLSLLKYVWTCTRSCLLSGALLLLLLLLLVLVVLLLQLLNWCWTSDEEK